MAMQDREAGFQLHISQVKDVVLGLVERYGLTFVEGIVQKAERQLIDELYDGNMPLYRTHIIWQGRNLPCRPQD